MFFRKYIFLKLHSYSKFSCLFLKLIKLSLLFSCVTTWTFGKINHFRHQLMVWGRSLLMPLLASGQVTNWMGIFVLHCISVCVYCISACLCISVCGHACIRIVCSGCCCIASPSSLRSALLCASPAPVSSLLIAASFSGIYYKSTLQTFFLPKNFNFTP